MVFTYYSKQYGIQILFYYLMKEKGVTRKQILDYYDQPPQTILPQEYYYNTFGGDNMRNWFADFAVHNAADMDYLSRAEFHTGVDYYNYLVQISSSECDTPDNYCEEHSYVWESVDTGTGGWVRPPPEMTTRGWSYNVFKIETTSSNRFRYLLYNMP